jgi:hypothetical protein
MNATENRTDKAPEPEQGKRCAVDLDRLEWALSRMEVPLYTLAEFDLFEIENRDAAASIVTALARELLAYLDAVQDQLGIAQVGSPYDPKSLAYDLDKSMGLAGSGSSGCTNRGETL